jgi:HD-like signal output (HDOD) protein
VLLEGAIQVVVKWDNHSGRPGTVQRGDVIAALPKSPGLLYCSTAIEQSTVIEITPTVLNYLPAETQLSVYRAAVASTSRINAYIRAVNGEVSSKNALLASYISTRETIRKTPIESERVQAFIRNIPALPAHAMDLALKLLQETTSVQEVVEAIKLDPSTASIVLRTVNSAQYGFQKKIESFYHACMILGFNNIYTLIMREAVNTAMPITTDTRTIHTHSCLISMIGYEIARVSKDVQAQTIITAALLHDVGKGVQFLMKKARWLPDDYIDTMDSSRLGADLLRGWGLPERLGQIVDNQQLPEFTPPDRMNAEYRREAGALHIAHVMESMIRGIPLLPESTIYTKDYMTLLGIPTQSPEELLKDRVMPNLTKNLKRLPKEIQQLLT